MSKRAHTGCEVVNAEKPRTAECFAFRSKNYVLKAHVTAGMVEFYTDVKSYMKLNTAHVEFILGNQRACIEFNQKRQFYFKDESRLVIYPLSWQSFGIGLRTKEGLTNLRVDEIIYRSLVGVLPFILCKMCK